MAIITGRDKQEWMQEEVKEIKIEEADTYCYLRIMHKKAKQIE